MRRERSDSTVDDSTSARAGPGPTGRARTDGQGQDQRVGPGPTGRARKNGRQRRLVRGPSSS
eukprot:4709042-Pleurochrysis_carterae.AAC.5